MKTFFSENITPIIIALAIIGAIIYSIFFKPGAIVNRKLGKIEKKRISDCQTNDYVKVEGQIKYVGNPILAPFSGRPCAYYYVIVEERLGYSNSRVNGKSKLHRWHTIKEESYGTNLFIKDGNSYAFIETEMIKSNVIVDKTYLSSTVGNPMEQLEKYLEKHGITGINQFGPNQSIRYKEGILVEGDTVTVAGKVAWKRKSELKMETPFERILVVGANDKEPVYLSNDPKALKLN